MLIYYGAIETWYIAGGTSAGTPQWAGLVALADQTRHRSVGFINPQLYRLGDTGLRRFTFHDITIGDNSFTYPADDGTEITMPGYKASVGWDPASGWGSPRANALVTLLALGG